MDHPYTEIPHPRWRFKSLKDFSSETLELLCSKLLKLIYEIPFPEKLIDVEICGSYIFECSCWKDLDVNICFKDKETQLKMREWFLSNLEKIKPYINALTHELQITIEICPTSHDQKTYNPIFSVLERKFYNCENCPMLVKAYFRPEKYSYELVSKKMPVAEWLEDKFA